MNDLFRIPLDFPNAPAVDDEFTASNGATYRWDGTVWMPIGSGAGVYLPLAGGTMDAGAVLTLGVDPNDPMDAATKRYVDTVAVGTRQIIGLIDARNGNCVYALATGFPNGPLINAATAGSGTDIICAVAGTMPPDPALPIEVWNLAMQVGDVLVSDGAIWRFIAIPHQTTVASQVAVIPAVFGAPDVQAALEQAEIQDMPPGGAVGQVLTKQTVADYAAEWSDPAATIDVNQLFRQGGNYGNVDLNTYTAFEFAGFGSTAANVPPRVGPATSNWARALFRNQQNNAHVEMLFETEAVNSAGNVYSAWMRSIGLNGGPGPWMQLALGNTGNFVAKTGDTMTGRLIIAGGGGAETSDNHELQLIGGSPVVFEIMSQNGGNFRYVNRGNDQGGLTYVSGGVATYVDWLIFNAVGNFVSLNNPSGTGTTIINGDATITGDLSATAGSFAGRVTAALAPTQNAHLANKGYVDQLFSAAPILVGVINAGTGNCQFADGQVGPVPAATGSRHYIICTTPGTIPGGPANGIVMRLGDELYDGLIAGVAGWILIAVGTGGITTTADQVALVPNVAGTNNVQAGMQVLNTNKVEKAGDTLTGRLAFDPATGPLVAAPPSTTAKSTGTRLQLWGNPNAANDTNTFGIGVENGSMWFNCAAANNGFKFYNNCVFSWNLNNQNFDSARTDVGRVGFQVGSATQCGYVHFNTLENTRRGYIGYKGTGNTLLLKAETGWTWEIPEALPYLNMSGAIVITSLANSNMLTLRKNNTQANTNTPKLRFEASDGRMMGSLFGTQLQGAGYYGTWPSQVRCTVGHGGYGEQTCWTTLIQNSGWTGFRVEGDINARSYANYSDASLKSDIAPLDPAVAQKAFESLSPVQFHWKPKKVEDPLAAPHGWRHGPDEDPDSRYWGFLAQDIEKGAPHLVQGSVGSKSYDLAGVIAVLCSKLKSMEDELHYLKAHTFSDDIDTKEHARRVLWPHGRTHKAKH